MTGKYGIERTDLRVHKILINYEIIVTRELLL